MRKGFDLAALAREQMGVSELNTAVVEEVRLVPVADIRRNENNFYAIGYIEDLAGSMELLGLIHPVIVKTEEDGGFTLIDGERRLTAAKALNWETIPAIVRRKTQSVIEELSLIEANRQQRKMSAADLSKQADRYMELLSQLKASGIDIPGRLRDRVAEAMQVSATKLGQLHAIREHLIPVLLDMFDEGKINESTAYEMSKAPEELQETFVEKAETMMGWEAREKVKRYFKCVETICPCTDAPCKMWKSRIAAGFYCSGCCSTCWRRSSCGILCPHIAPLVAEENKRAEKEKAEKEAAIEALNQAAAEDERKAREMAAKAWKDFKALREAAGVSREQVAELYDRFDSVIDADDIAALESGDEADSVPSGTCPCDDLLFFETVEMATLLGVSLNRLAGLPESPSIKWHRFNGTIPKTDQPKVLAWGSGGLRIVSVSDTLTCQDLFPEDYRFWAEITPPEEEDDEENDDE